MATGNSPALSAELVEKLLNDPSDVVRAETASKVAESFNAGLSDTERQLAEEIFRTMVKDAEVRVRQALSQSLKSNDNLPHDVAISLARDVDDVAMPILEFSSVLSDEDLVDIIRTQSQEHQSAIARRSNVSEKVSDTLVSHGNEDVVATLVSNKSANISDQTMNRVVEEFGSSEKVSGPMVARDRLPVGVAEKLVNLVSEQLRQQLMTRHELSSDVATDLLLEARERATMGLLGDDADRLDVLELVQQLNRNGRLTPSIILRAACMGDMIFAESALAVLCDIPVPNAYKLVHDRGDLGLKTVCERAGIPASLVPLFRIAVEVFNESEYDGKSGDRERFVESAIERILTSAEDRVDNENLDYLLAKLQQYAGVNRAN